MDHFARFARGDAGLLPGPQRLHEALRSRAARGSPLDSTQGLFDGLRGEDFTLLEVLKNLHDQQELIFGQLDRGDRRVNDKAEPCVDFGHQGLLPAERGPQGEEDRHYCRRHLG